MHIVKAATITLATLALIVLGYVAQATARPMPTANTYQVSQAHAADVGPTRADGAYCLALIRWNRAGIPSDALTRTVARRALHAGGTYRHTGTALITALFARGAFRGEALAALKVCQP